MTDRQHTIMHLNGGVPATILVETTKVVLLGHIGVTSVVGIHFMGEIVQTLFLRVLLVEVIPI
jgi:hypothetical protein